MRALALVACIALGSLFSRAAVADEPGAAAAKKSTRAAILKTAILDGGDKELAPVARALDEILPDTAGDLGLGVDLGVQPAVDPKTIDTDLPARAKDAAMILVAASIRAVGSEIELRIALAEPGARSIRVRAERAARDDVNRRAVVMLRDLVADLRTSAKPNEASQAAAPAPGGVLAAPARSAGRPILITNATLFGGLVGFSIQKSSGSDDPRLLYPLLAVGAGVGLGGSIIVAEEWDVGMGDAWYLTAGTWWPTVAAHLIYEGRFGPSSAHPGLAGDRFSFGLIGGTAGLTLSTLGLALHGMGDGGAVLAHSGGGFGLLAGGLTELMIRGDVHRTPFTGAGYGAALGWLSSAAIATQVEVSPSRVLLVDLGAFLGTLGGAALSSPFVFGEETKTKQRAFVGLTAGGALLGTGIALYASREGKKGVPKSETPVTWIAAHGQPRIGILGESEIGSRSAPIYGVGWSGPLLY